MSRIVRVFPASHQLPPSQREMVSDRSFSPAQHTPKPGSVQHSRPKPALVTLTVAALLRRTTRLICLPVMP